MTVLEIARKFAQYNQTEDAQKAYLLFLRQEEPKQPIDELEAASYIFFSHGDYQTAYTTFVSLYNRGFFQDELMNIMMQAFYLPNLEKQKKRYKENCKSLSVYPYFFHTEFPNFEDLPILFFPFNDNGFVPFYKSENKFGNFINFNEPIINRYFFRDLENPILADDVYSQYQLEYLHDSVRPSEWVARENHIYLHYTNWDLFCSYLKCLSLKKLLQSQKFIFLIEEEISQYPIDFKERFGIDYSKYPLKPIGIREVNRLIWHTQLSAHNGGDFFNEIFYGHPNLLAYESLMFDSILDKMNELRESRKKKNDFDTPIQRELSQIKHPTEKDYFVAYFLSREDFRNQIDLSARIAPVLFFQPHFSNILFEIKTNEKQDTAILHSEQYDRIKNSPIFRQFKYIKTFTPMRRITTSYGATVRFMVNGIKEAKRGTLTVGDTLTERLLNRSFMIDPEDKLYHDSILVRFEDGKLNPKATFTALAEFLDLPYTESMTYCSGSTGINPESLKGNDLGFDPAAIYRTYDDYTDDSDRALLEYFMRDAYKLYGYDFHYYKGENVDINWVKKKLEGICHLNQFIEETCYQFVKRELKEKGSSTEKAEEVSICEAKKRVEIFNENRLQIADILLHNLYFVNKNGQPLRMMTPLKLDPALLEQSLYH